MRRHWRTYRTLHPHPDGQRRWDQACQLLLAWGGSDPPPDAEAYHSSQEVSDDGRDLRTRLDATVRELGETGFADYLGQRVEELMGVALYDVERPPTGGAAVTVEYVFANEKEMQRLHLEEARGGGWRITAADASRREKSLIPYGTPIEEVE